MVGRQGSKCVNTSSFTELDDFLENNLPILNVFKQLKQSY